MLLELIIVLHLKILFTETPQIDCGGIGQVNGCIYTDTNTIYLSYYSDDINRTLYHEIGHAIFLKDDYSRVIIKDYPLMTNYRLNNPESYNTEYNILNESVADYFAEYMLNNKEFSVKYPSLYIYFRDTLNNKLR